MSYRTNCWRVHLGPFKNILEQQYTLIDYTWSKGGRPRWMECPCHVTLHQKWRWNTTSHIFPFLWNVTSTLFEQIKDHAGNYSAINCLHFNSSRCTTVDHIQNTAPQVTSHVLYETVKKSYSLYRNWLCCIHPCNNPYTCSASESDVGPPDVSRWRRSSAAIVSVERVLLPWCAWTAYSCHFAGREIEHECFKLTQLHSFNSKYCNCWDCQDACTEEWTENKHGAGHGYPSWYTVNLVNGVTDNGVVTLAHVVLRDSMHLNLQPDGQSLSNKLTDTNPAIIASTPLTDFTVHKTLGNSFPHWFFPHHLTWSRKPPCRFRTDFQPPERKEMKEGWESPRTNQGAIKDPGVSFAQRWWTWAL